MKHLLKVGVMLSVVSMIWSATALAQTPNAVPVELFSCSWQEGKNMDDLNKVLVNFNKWSDKHPSNYTAWVITPQFRTSDEDFGVGWIGAWPDGSSMGSGLSDFSSEGGKLQAEFDKVIDCSGSHMLTSTIATSPASTEDASGGLIMFSSCTLAEGKTGADAIKAQTEISAALAALGSNTASWVMFPALGAGDIDFDYYNLTAFTSYKDFGAAWDVYVTGGGMQKAASISAGVATCDSPRLYDSQLVRAGTSS